MRNTPPTLLRCFLFGVDLDHQVSDESGPAGLVRRSYASTRIPVEVLVKRDQVMPGRIALKPLERTEDRAAAVAVEEDSNQPARDLVGDLIERHQLSRSGRTLDGEIAAEVAVINPQSFDQQVVDGHPYRPSPVGVAAE